MPSNVSTPERRSTPTGSLYATATVYTDNRQYDRVDWRNLPCPTSGLYSLCESHTKLTTEGSLASADGAWLIQAVECESPVTDLDLYGSEAIRLLEVSSTVLAEQLLLTGGPDADPTGTYLQSSGVDVVGGSASALDVVPAISAMIEALDDYMLGGRGYIHVPRWTVPYLTFYGLAVRNNSELIVANTDHRFIAGAGYDGTGPADAQPGTGEAWIYGTGHVDVHQTPITIPGLDDNDQGTIIPFLDPATNVKSVIAERAAAVVFDDCAHLAVLMCTPNPGPGCGEEA